MFDRRDWWCASWIAWRNLRSKQRRAGLSFMTMVSVVGVCIGVAALIIVLSVMGGFEQDLMRKLLKGQPHLEITASNSAAGFSLKEFPIEGFRKKFPEASDVEPYVEADVVLKREKSFSSATIFGIDPERNAHLWGFGGAITKGEFSSLNEKHAPIVTSEDLDTKYPGIILGEQLSIQLGVDIGDELVVISPQGATDAGSIMTGGTLARHFVVVATFRTDLFNYDSRWAVVNLSEARRFMADYDSSLDQEEYVSGVAINFGNPYSVEMATPRVKDYEGLQASNWQTANKSILFALKLEKFTMGAILMLIVIVAAFSISGTMMMNVFHRRTQVALMRSLGMTKFGVARLFILHGLSISIIGIIVGLIGGVVVCALIYYFQFINLPEGVYYLKRLPVRFLPWNYVVICGMALIFGVLASLYPAMTAAKQEPSEGLRW
jgi:lipoprotein-releasing system permease protein